MIQSRQDTPQDAEEIQIELSHRLPMAAYHAAERWHPERIGALALYCSDGRWGEAFDEFCHRHLCIPRYDRWAVAGGPAWLVGPSDGLLLRAARTQLDFLVKFHELERIVLITHFGCAWYGQTLKRQPADCLDQQINDVHTAAATLGRWYQGVDVECFLAMRQRDWLSFHRLKR